VGDAGLPAGLAHVADSFKGGDECGEEEEEEDCTRTADVEEETRGAPVEIVEVAELLISPWLVAAGDDVIILLLLVGLEVPGVLEVLDVVNKTFPVLLLPTLVLEREELAVLDPSRAFSTSYSPVTSSTTNTITAMTTIETNVINTYAMTLFNCKGSDAACGSGSTLFAVASGA